MRRIILDCSDPVKGCEQCVFNAYDGCRAPSGLMDCYTERGVWRIEEEEDKGGQK